MIVLPDVNVLVAVAWPSHVHHREATRWFDLVADDGWATAPATEFGFVRMCMNPAVVGRGTTMVEAISMLSEFRGVGRHIFWDDGVAAIDLASTASRIQGYRQVTDAHLVTLAASHDGALATFDRGAMGLAPDEASVVLINGHD